MSDLLLTNAKIVDPATDRVFDGGLVTKNGLIKEIFASGGAESDDAFRMRNPAATHVDCGGKYLAPGIVDVGVKVCEPGERHKESFRTAGLAAAAGGVTTMVTRPDTIPTVDTPETLEFAKRRGAEMAPVNIAPMAALTKNRAGKEMVEMGFLLDAGAVAFTDGDNVVRDIKVLSRAMTYARSLGALVLGHPQEPTLSQGSAVTSGKFASLRGLPGVSPMAERLGIERDLTLVEMSGVAYHADQLSCEHSLPALRRAKELNLDVTAGVSVHHLTLNELDVGDYRTFFKVKPPLRTETSRQAMVDAVSEGLVDIICSMHTPQDEESKRLPFEEAASGAVGLETLLPAAMRLYHSGQLSLPKLFKAMSLAPARRFGLPAGRLEEGAPADLVLFDPDAPFVLDRFALKSKSKNTPFDGQRMQGKVLKTFVAGQEVFST
ncbi:MAG: dihydroorotase [Pseudomonadota bacterium]